jgi:hypothetical protein
MSCFMLGDRIRIETRRDYGSERGHGAPWIVEINGLSGMLTLKKGKADQQVGTTVVITSRPKPAFLDPLDDQVKLINVLERYALAVEFPIHARCTIPDIAGKLQLQAGMRPVSTDLESADVGRVIRFEQDLSEFDPGFRGVVCESFLIDGTGAPTLANEEAHWKFDEHNIRPERADGSPLAFKRLSSGICLDGILVEPPSLHVPGGSRPRVLLDVHGAHKPMITPARGVPQRHRRDWNGIHRKLNLAEGRLWAQLVEKFPKLSAETLWRLAVTHSGSLANLPSRVLWDRSLIPVRDTSNNLQWENICDLGTVRVEHEPVQLGPGFRLFTRAGDVIGFPQDFLYGKINTNDLTYHLNRIVLGMATPTVEQDALRFRLLEPGKRDEAPSERSPIYASFVLPFSGELIPALGLFCPATIFNQRHPLVEFAERSQFQVQWGEFERFAQGFGFGFYPRAFSGLNSKPDRPSQMLKRLAHWYLAIDWSHYDPVLRPPYRVW